MVLLISSTLIVVAISGFVSLSDSKLFSGVAGQLAHGLVCFALVGVALWRFGWIVGVIDFALVFYRVERQSEFLQILQKGVRFAKSSHHGLTQ